MSWIVRWLHYLLGTDACALSLLGDGSSVIGASPQSSQSPSSFWPSCLCLCFVWWLFRVACVCVGGGLQDFLISVLEQKDQLADQLYTLNNAYADVKARLGMAEFEKEKLQAESRAAARKGGHGGSGTAGPSPGGSDHGEAHSALVAERDRLAATLADVCLT